MKSLSQRGTHNLIFTAELPTTAKHVNQPVSSTNTWMKKMWYIYIRDISQPLKEGKTAICINMNGSWGHYVKWNREWKKLHDLIFMWNSKPNKQKQKTTS